jgi:hypothetical protein
MGYALVTKPGSLTACTLINSYPLETKESRPQMELSLQHNDTQCKTQMYISFIYTVDLLLLLYFDMLLKHHILKTHMAFHEDLQLIACFCLPKI